MYVTQCLSIYFPVAKYIQYHLLHLDYCEGQNKTNDQSLVSNTEELTGTYEMVAATAVIEPGLINL